MDLSKILEDVKNKVSGWKTIITAVAALLTAIAAWAAGELSNMQLAVAAFAALEVIFIRLGINKAGK